MRMVLTTLALSAGLVAADASAQGIDLTGRYRCVVLCLSGAPGGFAFITQNGWDLNWSTMPASRREAGSTTRVASGCQMRTRARSIR